MQLLLLLLLMQALFEVGRASAKTHQQHLLEISDSAEPGSTDEAAAAQQPGNVAGPSNAAGAQVQREQHPAAVPGCMVDAMLRAEMSARQPAVRPGAATAWVHSLKHCVCAGAGRDLQP
jgi:hypothetical protein